MGTVVISIDAELGWGFHDLESPPADRIEAARDGWRTLLDLFDHHDVPATWAIVGHLLLEDCAGVHDEHPLGPLWFERERGDWADRPELRYGRDLVEATVEADADHEIGFHTFSHVEFGHEDVSESLARSECVQFFRAIGDDDAISPRSVVFPRNMVGHRAVLSEWGFDCYRGPAPEQTADHPVAASAQKLARATVSAPPLVEPRIDEYGLVNVPASLYLFDFEGRPRSVVERLWDDPVVRAARRGIDRAVAEDGLFHAWLHPNNVVDDRDAERMAAIVSYIDRRRSEGALTVSTMQEVADEVTEEKTVEPPGATP